jgi:hypothetical protein
MVGVNTQVSAVGAFMLRPVTNYSKILAGGKDSYDAARSGMVSGPDGSKWTLHRDQANKDGAVDTLQQQGVRRLSRTHQS